MDDGAARQLLDLQCWLCRRLGSHPRRRRDRGAEDDLPETPDRMRGLVAGLDIRDHRSLGLPATEASAALAVTSAGALPTRGMCARPIASHQRSNLCETRGMKTGRGWVIVMLGCSALTACSSGVSARNQPSAGATADGPRKLICGTWIGRANNVAGSGPWFVDATKSAPGPIVADARSSGTWLRLTNDCSHGATSSITNSAVIKVSSRIRAKDGRDEAVLVNPLERGSSTLMASRDGKLLTRVRFAISNAFVLPSPSGPPSS